VSSRVTSSGGGYGPPDDPPIELDVPLTRHEMATLIATSRESVVRALTSMRARGVVSTAARRITIRDVSGLRRYARGEVGEPAAVEAADRPRRFYS
jgi:CRP-like cAMP-binding protein